VTDSTKKILMAKAKGFTISIEKMNDNERSRTPSFKFGTDYNLLRDAVASRYPSVTEFLPPSVGMKTEGGRSETGYTAGYYSEIYTYCEQIFQMLSDIEEA
jgi:hypothetical protein